MRDWKEIVFTLVGAALLSASVLPAQASTRVRLHQSDFYAYAAEEPSETARRAGEAGAQSTSCYVSFSAAETSRGIRHWTGKC